MKYTMQSGVERPLLAKFPDRYKYLAPLILLLFIVGIVGLSSPGPTKRPARPLTLGIYTIKTSDKPNEPKAATSKNGGSSSTKSDPTINTLSSESSSLASAAPVYTGTGSSLQGGMGGGSLPSGGETPTGGTISGGSGGGSTSPSPTVVCTNLLTTAQLCTACTPPLTLLAGQKALLYSDGTCVAVN